MATETEGQTDCNEDPFASAAKFIVPIGVIFSFLFLLQMEIVLFLITIVFTVALGVRTAT